MKNIHVVAAVIRQGDRIFATQRGYGDYKDWWEFPGGKVEPGETPEQALAREIREELNTEIEIDSYLMTVEYDYPKFHMEMDCYMCRLAGTEPQLLEHEAAAWLGADELDTVMWLPSDRDIIERLRDILNGQAQDM